MPNALQLLTIIQAILRELPFNPTDITELSFHQILVR